MGIYSNKFFLETELDSVQDPDNPGVDLDQIEEDIVGDGNEAHSEEIEDAASGIIDDPLDEAYMIIYESEYNYNKLLQAIGMKELSEASYGRDFVLEGVDIKGFFGKVKDFIVGMFKKITAGFKNILGKMTSMVMNDKKFVAKYKSKIIEGEKNLKKKSSDYDVKIFTFPHDLTFQAPASNVKGIVDKALDMVKNKSISPDEFNSDKFENDNIADLKRIFKGTGISITSNSISDLREKLIKYYFGDEEKAPSSSFNATKICEILSADKELKTIKDNYSEIKKEFNTAISEINNAEKRLLAAEKSELTKNYISRIANNYSQNIKYQQSVYVMYYSVLNSAAKKKREQARKLANAYIKAAGGYSVKKEQTSYSEGSIFSNIELI